MADTSSEPPALTEPESESSPVNQIETTTPEPPNTAGEAATATEATACKEPQPEKEKKVAVAKIEVRLQATGDAPIMKQKNYKVEGEKKISWVISFIRKYLKLEEKENLFLYVSQAFAPSPDQTLANLCECFGAEGKLTLYYSRSQAWG